MGCQKALDIAIRAIVDPGDQVLIAQPSYVSYAPCVTLAGGVPVPVECTETDKFKLNPEYPSGKDYPKDESAHD